MSKLLDLADRGDEAIARLAAKHLPQSPQAIERREHVKGIMVNIGKAALAGVVLFGLYKGTDSFLDATVKQAEHVQEVGEEYLNQPNGGGIDILEP